ncbi:polyhydroxyalkanoate synthesis repressor PhaR [Opacimonas viscosa]|uniref:Polyhydroxyalkanoate synthesis repressor PhaR n=1 Tax=Opacimonas viscosa TaxID=2961944 RepID=A0AA41X508_9ALTE|nr:polyhydroxyalkanoate synthesis repressor PhaR [Opacimonas viscosa]
MISIKKYPNRRLYDTSKSVYINLEDIKRMINDRIEFEIVDSKTKDVITKSVLLQIISESETNQAQSLLTDKLLQQLIRFYDSDMQPVLRQYLEQSLVSFMEQQDQMQGMMKTMVDSTPLGMFSKMMESNMQAWQTTKKNEDKGQ